ncbi:MAG: hypothetical protein ACK4YP_17700, partial [Myxococcota bacterium]
NGRPDYVRQAFEESRRRLEVDVINIVVDTKSTQGKKQLLPPSVWFIIRPYGRLISSSRTLVRI